MTTLKERIIIPHGVVFVYDPTMIIEVPEDTGAGPILSTINCVSIWTIDEDDGESSLILTDNNEEISGNLAFEGIIETSGHFLGFNDSGTINIMRIPVANKNTKISIYTNDEVYPDNVVCFIHK